MQPLLLLWLISSAVDSAKLQQAYFAAIYQRYPRRWPGFLVSLALHLLALLLLPTLIQVVAPGPQPGPWALQAKLSQPLRIRVPERLYLASDGRRATGRAARAAGRRRPAGGGGSQTATARPPAAAGRAGTDAAGRPRRRFELPPLARKVDDSQTILQAQHPPDLPPPTTVRLAELFFWAPPPPPQTLPKLVVTPGYETPPQALARLDAPPRLEVPSAEAARPYLKALGVPELQGPGLSFAPAPALPIRTTSPQEPGPAAREATVDRSAGDPINILSLSTNPRPLREILTVLPSSQLGRLPAARPGSEAQAPSGVSGAGEPPRPVAEQAQLAAGHLVVPPPLPKASGEPGAESSPVVEERARTAPAEPASTSPPGAAAAREAALAAAATRIVHPSSGVFDVVVQSSDLEGFPESAGILSGKPIYSVFLNVGGPKEWVLQYCLPASDNPGPEVTGGVVRLGSGSPLAAPYPRVTFRPSVKRRADSSYVMVHGFLDTNGRLEGLKVLGASGAEDSPAIVSVLQLWEFRPAVRDGRPARVEILLAVPPE